ncbi:hypothetical protein HPB51_015224 [Rhipicephalus microplus]|uniref:Uncharacterized protein n=1 Tax=Rhipicephalus microplus TaxID=6941 RepID=A0A9J6EAK9_RHIMP|nr:hypothetical protein HPB51_015224 [Rhipicephalus microplus]
MADDKKEADWKSRKTPPKKQRCDSSSSGEETGPPGQPQPLPPPQPMTVLSRHKQIQTEFQINAENTLSMNEILEQRSGHMGPDPANFSVVGPSNPKDAAAGETSFAAPSASKSQEMPLNVSSLLAQRHEKSESASIAVPPIKEQPRATTSTVVASGGSGEKAQTRFGFHCFRGCDKTPPPTPKHMSSTVDKPPYSSADKPTSSSTDKYLYTSADSDTYSPEPRLKSQYSRITPHPDTLKVEEVPYDPNEMEPYVEPPKTFRSEGVNTLYTFISECQIQMHSRPPPTPPVHSAEKPSSEQEEKMDEDDGESAD